jgi:CheY-like chemotaxis protein
MTAGRGQRVLLRAEITHAGKRIVTHTTELHSRAVVVEWPGDLPTVGDRIDIQLSFPRFVRPFAVSARVASAVHAGGHGNPATARCDIVSTSDEALAFLAAMAGERAKARLEPGTDYRCLLVEDNGFIRDLFTYGMDKYRRTRNAAITLALANDADEAWSMLAESKYDMAIVDYYLPTRNGSELIARMRAQPRYVDIPVVAISVGGAEARAASMAAGADLFLDKPIVMRDLFETLDRLAVCAEGQ